MKLYKYKDIIIPENKLQKRLKGLGITMEDLIEIDDRKKIQSEEYPFMKRLNTNTSLCAYTLEQMNLLCKWYGVRYES